MSAPCLQRRAYSLLSSSSRFACCSHVVRCRAHLRLVDERAAAAVPSGGQTFKVVGKLMKSANKEREGTGVLFIGSERCLHTGGGGVDHERIRFVKLAES